MSYNNRVGQLKVTCIMYNDRAPWYFGIDDDRSIYDEEPDELDFYEQPLRDIRDAPDADQESGSTEASMY